MQQSDSDAKLRKLVNIIPATVLEEYRREAIDPLALEAFPEEYKLTDPLSWVVYNDLQRYYKIWMQNSRIGKLSAASVSASQTPTPSSESQPVTPRTISKEKLPSESQNTSSRTSTPILSGTLVNPIDLEAEKVTGLSALLDDDDDDDDEMLFPVAGHIQDSVVPATSRKRAREDSPEVEIVSYQVAQDLSEPKGPQKRQRKSKTTAQLPITRNLKVDRVVQLAEAPLGWDVSHDEVVAYILDLSKYTGTWPASNSIAAFIRSCDQDSWGGGSGGSKNAADSPQVVPFNNARCQSVRANCQGIWHCELVPQAFLSGVQRYGLHDADERARKWWDTQRDLNAAQNSSAIVKAVELYKRAHRGRCHYVDDDGKQCDALPVIRPLKKRNLNGKKLLIGCDGYEAGQASTAHRLTDIPRDVNEDLVKELFQNDGVLSEATRAKYSVIGSSESCSYICQPRNAKGAKLCPYSHTKDGQVYQAKLVNHACPAKICILSPHDDGNRRAVVIPGDAPHNHPAPPRMKPRPESKDLYLDAAREQGVLGLTVARLDNGPSVRQRFGDDPALIDPAFTNPRHKRTLLRNEKQKEQPHGSDLTAVLHLKMNDEKTLPLEDRYIHHVHTASLGNESTGDIVVTMLPGLAERVHRVRASLHDNTYKRLKDGQWKDWEVVWFDERLNMRVTGAHIYCTRETTDSFEHIWQSWLDTITTVTGQKLRFYFLDGVGLEVVLVDGNQPQIEGFGRVLKRIHDSLPPEHAAPFISTGKHRFPSTTGAVFSSAWLRNFDTLSNHLTAEENTFIRSIVYLETEEEVDEYWQKCEAYGESNPYIANWKADKQGKPCARKMDTVILQKLELVDKERVLPNHRNTVTQRFHANINRRSNKAAKNAQHQENVIAAQELDALLLNANNLHKKCVADIKALEDERRSHGLSDHQRERLTAAQNARSEAWTNLQQLRQKKRTFEMTSTTPKGLRNRINAGKAVKGKSVLSDPSSSDFDIPDDVYDTAYNDSDSSTSVNADSTIPAPPPIDVASINFDWMLDLSIDIPFGNADDWDWSALESSEWPQPLNNGEFGGEPRAGPSRLGNADDWSAPESFQWPQPPNNGEFGWEPQAGPSRLQ
ncbi:hypothetical protein BDZ89DRAFT_1153643 [Hymenopellis radicata]|nr:hypothetical protein BDZ89DRAFT_1153643 [Hymenopellis radicata]